MENRSDDRCTRTSGQRTKTAAGLTVYLLEELSDARMRCAQLKKMVAEATDLVEKSSHRDHLFEVAAHLIHGIPDALFRLEKALDASAMSAAKMDYEEIKQNLRPEKAEEMDQVLQDARLRYLTRRSQQLASPSAALAEVERIASVTEQTGQVPVGDLLVLAAALELGVKTASETQTKTAADRLRGIVQAASAEKSRVALAQALRTFLAEALQPTAGQALQAVLQSSGSREEVIDGFKQSNPDLTDEQLEEIADQWERNKNVVKDKQANDTWFERTVSSIEHNAGAMLAQVRRLGGLTPALRRGYGRILEGQISEILSAAKVAQRRLTQGSSLDGPGAHMASGRARDPHWIQARYPGMAEDGTPFKRGDRVLYWPNTKTFMVGPKAEAEWRKFMSEVQDEAFMNYRMATEETVARFEEGVPADPTENMSPEDAEAWEEMNDEHGDNFKAASVSKTAFVPDALMADRISLFVESMRDRLLIAQRSLKVGDWRHFKVSLRHFTNDLGSIFAVLGMTGAADKMSLIQRELVSLPLGTSGGDLPAQPRMAAEQAWEEYGHLVEASSREKVIEGFKEANPSLTDEQLEEIADQWERNKDVVKSKHAAKREISRNSKYASGDVLTGAWSIFAAKSDD